jgi:hypothetical protein
MEMTEFVLTGFPGICAVTKQTAPDRERLLFVFVFDLSDNLFTAIETVRRYSMSQVCFSGCRIYRQGRTLQLVM